MKIERNVTIETHSGVDVKDKFGNFVVYLYINGVLIDSTTIADYNSHNVALAENALLGLYGIEEQ